MGDLWVEMHFIYILYLLYRLWPLPYYWYIQYWCLCLCVASPRTSRSSSLPRSLKCHTTGFIEIPEQYQWL